MVIPSSMTIFVSVSVRRVPFQGVAGIGHADPEILPDLFEHVRVKGSVDVNLGPQSVDLLPIQVCVMPLDLLCRDGLVL